MSTVTLLTDFGLEDAWVGIMKGVILGINSEARISWRRSAPTSHLLKILPQRDLLLPLRARFNWTWKLRYSGRMTAVR